MNGWTLKESLAVGLSFFAAVLATIAAARTVALWTDAAISSLLALFLMPMVCGAAIAYVLKKRGRSLRVAAAALAALVLLLFVLAKNNSATTRFLSRFTGHYNLEATGFYLLFAVLICAGMLAGFRIGHFVRQYQHKR